MSENVPPRLRFQVFQRDGFRCTYCGRSAKDGATLEADHVVPVVDGGETTLANLKTACFECNNGKGAMPIAPIEVVASGDICRTPLWVVAFGLRVGLTSYGATMRHLRTIRSSGPAIPPQRRGHFQMWNAVLADPAVQTAGDQELADRLAAALAT